MNSIEQDCTGYAANHEDQITLHTMDYRFNNMLYQLLSFGNINPVDWETLELTLDKETFQETAQTALAIDAQREKTKQVLQKYRRNFLEAAARIAFLNDYANVLYRCWYYDASYKKGLNQKLRLMTIPSANDANGYTGVVFSYGAMNRNSQHKEDAYLFLRAAMDTAFVKNASTLSINKNNNKEILDLLSSAAGEETVKMGSGEFSTNVLSSPMREMLESILENITGAVIYNPSVAAIIQGSMGGYISDNRDFDTCYTDMINKLKLYLHE